MDSGFYARSHGNTHSARPINGGEQRCSGYYDGALGPTSAWPDRLTHAEIVPLAFAGDAFLALRFEPGKPPSGVWFGPQNPEQDPNRYTWASVDLDALLSANPARIAAKEPR